MLFLLQLDLTAGEELEIEYEVDGWFYVSMTVTFILILSRSQQEASRTMSCVQMQNVHI